MNRRKILERIDIFKGFSPEDLDPIAELCGPRECKANEGIFAEKAREKKCTLYIREFSWAAYLDLPELVSNWYPLQGRISCCHVALAQPYLVFMPFSLEGDQGRPSSARRPDRHRRSRR